MSRMMTCRTYHWHNGFFFSSSLFSVLVFAEVLRCRVLAIDLDCFFGLFIFWVRRIFVSNSSGNQNLEIFARNSIQINHSDRTYARIASMLKSKHRCECLAELITVISNGEKSKYRQKRNCDATIRSTFGRTGFFWKFENWLRCLWYEQKPLAVITRQGLRSYDIHNAYIRVHFICSHFIS